MGARQFQSYTIVQLKDADITDFWGLETTNWKVDLMNGKLSSRFMI